MEEILHQLIPRELSHYLQGLYIQTVVGLGISSNHQPYHQPIITPTTKKSEVLPMESPLTKMDEKNAQNLGNSQGIMAWLKRSPASPLPMRLPTARPSAMVSPPVQVVKLFGFIFLVQQKMMTGTFLLQHKKNGG